MDIDGVERCPRCFSVWDGISCDSCGHTASEKDASSACHLAEETILQNRYLIGVVLGAGGFGVTYAAWDLKLDGPVAIKEYFPSSLASRDTAATDEVTTQSGDANARAFAAGLNRFIREARVLALLNTHKDIVAIRDCIEENGTAYIIMEYLRGTNLERYAADCGGRVSPKELLPLMRAPIEALAKIHEMGMLHRDVSPANLMLEPGGSIKLIDFGAVLDLAQQSAGQNATMILNRRYAAPEQFQPGEALGPWTDVYGVCATLYTLLSGQTPREAAGGAVPSLKAQGVSVSRRLDRAILRGLAENPKHRIQSIPELISPLYGVPLPQELLKRRRLMRTAAGAIAATLLISLAVLLNALWGLPGGAEVFYRLGAGGFSISHYGGDAANLSPRGQLLGIGVTAVDEMAFHGNASLTEVEIREGVTAIGAFAFAECANLRAVWLPDSVKAIAPGAFDRCHEGLTLFGSITSYAAQYAAENGLRFCDPSLFIADVEGGEATLRSMTDNADGLSAEIVIPESLYGAPVTVVDTYEGFFPATSRLVFPNTVRRIEARAFEDRPALKEIVLPDGVTFVGDSAFYNCYLDTLTIPDTVTHIGESAFSGSPTLTEVRLPASLKHLGVKSFFFCKKLAAVSLPEGLSAVSEGAFYACYGLEKVSLPKSLRSVESYAFGECRALVEIVLPDGTEEIGLSAFFDCCLLSRVVIPPSVTQIGFDAFYGCAPDLTIYGFQESAAEAYALKNDIPFVNMESWTPVEAFTYETNEDGVTITGYAGGFSDVVMPDYIEGIAVTGLANALFYRDQTLRSAVLPRMVTVLPILCFYDCHELALVKLPKNLEVIRYHAFQDCPSLKAIELPATVTEVDFSAFEGCKALETLTLPAGPLLLYGMFTGNDALKKVVFQEGIQFIPDWMSGLKNLQEVTIPASVRIIAPGAFENCRKTLTVRGVEGSFAETWCRENGIAFEAN